jgi:signal transduction histidine kinase
MYIEQSTADKRTPSPGWTLFLQHEAGSLDAAVAQARRRNLFLSFGILSVLAASAGLVMINARRSEKLAAQQMEFVATVSHELRTPLAVIRSAAQNLSAGVVNDASQAQRYGDLIESEGRRLTDMVEQVLEYAGINDARRHPVPKPMDAVPVLRDVVASSASLPEASGVNFDVRIDENVPQVMADEAAIRRALHNLIGNALKYARDGQWVGITATRGAGADDGFVLVSVTDRGQGIAPADLSHIFEPFYRGRGAVEQQVRGNGIGLSLVQQLIQALGGRVSVQSTPGEGARFTLHIPVASVATVAADSSPTAEPA